MALDIAQLLAFAVKNNASDLHISAGGPPMIRVDGDMRRVNLPDMSHKDVQSMIYDIMNDKQRKAYEEFFETDFSFEIPKLARFRVNAFNQNRGAAAVRSIATRWAFPKRYARRCAKTRTSSWSVKCATWRPSAWL